MGADAPTDARSAAFHLLLVALGAVFAALAIAPHTELGRSLTSGLLTASLGATIWATSRSPKLVAVGLALAIASSVGWFGSLLGLPERIGLLGPALSSAYFLAAAAVLSQQVFRTRFVTEDHLVGSICIYLLLVLAFACAYLFLDQLDPGAFALRAAGGRALADFTYLSLVTMTTLGYGDIVPVSGPARALAVLQSSMGVLYSAIAVARLVAIHLVGGAPPSAEPTQPWYRQRLRNLLIALSCLVLLPIAFGDFGGAWLRQGLGAALLLAALYGLGGGPVARVATVLAVLALALRFWTGEDGDGRLALLAYGLEVLVFGAGIAVIARHAMLQDEVNREVLFGASCFYVLLGIWSAAMFALVSALGPGALDPPAAHSGQFLYLSFMTLTTTGFCDMLPTNRLAELVSGITACMGIFYPAILVARLVSLSSQGAGPSD
ncbi:MAG: ion channel [Myxococcota bacterium]